MSTVQKQVKFNGVDCKVTFTTSSVLVVVKAEGLRTGITTYGPDSKNKKECLTKLLRSVT